ncbi:MAG: helix-turn-helix transcriptional regulator [Planctomycetaceae bacterium]|nr:helix-turn-helix transcriptional regulator [Planctomycetaceae bacterium]
MARQRVHCKIERSPGEMARIKALRDSFQKERPSLETLVESGEYMAPTTLGEFLDIKAIAHALKEMRQHVKMSLAEAASITGMDRAAISRLENGLCANTTINTINRLAHAYGKRLTFSVEDEPELAR